MKSILCKGMICYSFSFINIYCFNLLVNNSKLPPPSADCPNWFETSLICTEKQNVNWFDQAGLRRLAFFTFSG
jgi:hypothetical protein